MALRISEKIVKRRGRSVEHQQTVLLAFRQPIPSGEFEDAPQLLAGGRPLRIGDRCFLRSGHGDGPYSAAANAGFAPGKKAANSPTTSPTRLRIGSDETA